MAISITNNPARGFSLLEVLLVVVLMAAIGALTVTSLGGGMDGMRLRHSVREMANELRHARAQAIASGQAQLFELNPAARTWTTGSGRYGQWSDALSVRFTGARELQPDAQTGRIVFFADGTSSGGRIELARGSVLRRIEVAWLTGEVRVSKADAP